MARNYWAAITADRIARRRLLTGGVGLGLAAGALSLVGCGGDDEGGGGSTSKPSVQGELVEDSTRGGTRGGTFGEITNTWNHFNPVVDWSQGAQNVGVSVYDRLISTRPGPKFVLEAAESVEQPDSTTVMFKLRPDLVYQNKAPVNGRKVTSEDIKLVQEYVTQVPNAFDKGFQLNFLDSVQAPDERTVIFKLKKPSAYLFGYTQLGSATSQLILPKELLGNLERGDPVGSGPYQLVDQQPNVKLSFRRFDGYRGKGEDLPYIDERVRIVLTDTVAQEAAFRSGQIHAWIAPPNIWDRVEREIGSSAVLEKRNGLSPAPVMLNMTRPELPWRKDVRVRQALYRATNREQLIELIYNGKASLPAGAIPTGLTAWQVDAKDTAAYWKSDLKEAKQLLDAAGWDYGKEWEILQQTNPLKMQLAEAWSNQMNQIGAKFRVTAIPFAEWLPNRIGRKDYDLTIDPSPADDTPAKAIRHHHSDQQGQLGGFGLQDLEVDAMIEKSESEIDVEKNIALVKQIQIEVLKRYSSAIFLLTADYGIFRSSKLMNYEVNPVSGPMYRTNMWLKS